MFSSEDQVLDMTTESRSSQNVFDATKSSEKRATVTVMTWATDYLLWYKTGTKWLAMIWSYCFSPSQEDIPNCRRQDLCTICVPSLLDMSSHTHTHPFSGPLSGTTRVSRYQKGKNQSDFTEARDSEWQWHQLGHMQVCTSLQTDNHASNP